MWMWCWRISRLCYGERVGHLNLRKRASAVGDLEIDSESHTVSCAGKSLDLSPREFDLLLL